MLTRGHIIGKLIDDLAVLQSQIQLRCQIGLTDLNKFSEDFIKEVLNITFDIQLKNLNEGRSNEPGLDLGDLKSKMAFQVTSTAKSDKINDTLQRINEIQCDQYDEIGIFILGKKQNSYVAVKQDLMDKCNFQLDSIMDIADLGKHLVTLDYERLYSLHKLFEREFQIVLTEFEIPNNEGVYPTSLFDKLEIAPTTFCENAKDFFKMFPDGGYSLEDLEVSFKKLGQLPRVTRELLEIMISIGTDGPFDNYLVDYQELKRKLKIPEQELKEEIGILMRKGFAYDPEGPDPEISLKMDTVTTDIIYFAMERDCLGKILVSMDFTLLDG
ncbi:SMEK domain-containing protein [Flagellimonas olearia]|nr:SMEK domain-containing protein [Allomuricauda olearia]